MRDELPSRIENMECGVVNLDAGSGGGTHWVAYWKDGPAAIYFDSYGLDPPRGIGLPLPQRQRHTHPNLPAAGG